MMLPADDILRNLKSLILLADTISRNEIALARLRNSNRTDGPAYKARVTSKEDHLRDLDTLTRTIAHQCRAAELAPAGAREEGRTNAF